MPTSIRAAVLAPCLAPCLAAALTPAALAQTAITIEVENPVLMPGESTVVTMFAGFDPSDYAIATVGTDFRTSVGSDGWSEPTLLSRLWGPGSSTGVPSATGYDGILAYQINFGTSGPYADPTNPIAFWQATYTAPADVGDSFLIDVSTMTSRYDVYILREGAHTESRLDDLVEGAATIRVIPAPASASLLAIGLLAMRRRR